LIAGDDDLLGVLAEDPRAKDMLDQFGPGTLMLKVIPVWREHRMARTDWAPDAQAYALRALQVGFFELEDHPCCAPDLPLASPAEVMAATVTALLGPSTASKADVAAEAARILHEARTAVLGSITTTRK